MTSLIIVLFFCLEFLSYSRNMLLRVNRDLNQEDLAPETEVLPENH